MNDQLILTPQSAASAAVQAIIARLDRDLLERYGPEDIHGIDGAEFDRAGGFFLVASLGAEAVGCGAFRPVEPGVAEVKRVFVDARHRGRGIAAAVVGALEGEMRRRGFESAVLETGERQPEAIALYRKLGYFPIPAFGDYAGCKLSRCFAKSLRAPADAANGRAIPG